MTASLLVACALVATRHSVGHILAVGLLVAMVIEAPPLALAAFATAPLLAARRVVRTRSLARFALSRDLADLAELTALGMTGGLAATAALRLAGDSIGGPIADDVAAVLRRAHVDGLSAAAPSAGLSGPLLRTVGRAAATGAPLLDAVSRLADQLHADLAARRLAAVRKLPVAMLFPLTLLILPGFLLLTVAPALFDAHAGLEI